MSPLRAYLLQKSARERAGDVARELYPSGKDPGFQEEVGDVVRAIERKDLLSLPKELGQAALAGQATLAKNTGTNLPLIGADDAVADKRKRRNVWRSEFARYRIPFSDSYLSGGGDFGRPDMVQAAFRAAGKEISEVEALNISVRMSKQFEQRQKDREMSKAAGFSMPENPDIKDDNEKYRLSAGGNDWENANTWCWVDLGDYRGDVTRLWFKVNFPEGTTPEDDYDPKTMSREAHEAAAKAGKEHGERAWKKWIETAKKCVKAYKEDLGIESGDHYSRHHWERGFRDALMHPDMASYVAEHGEMRSKFVEKKAAAPNLDKMKAILRRAGELSKALGADSADRYTMEHLGSVYSVAKRRLRNQIRQPGPAPQGPTRDSLSSLVAKPSAPPSDPLGQLLLPFMKQGCLKARIRRARNITHTHPTPGQASAGNYAKGEVSIHGMTVKLENPKGTERRGYDKDGNITWRRTMQADYGYFKNSKAIDGDAVDCFIGDDPESNFVVAIDQKKADGSFDETKFVLGCTTQEQAEKLYLAHYPRGWKLGPVSTTTVQQLKEWLKNGDTKAPFKGQMVKAAARWDKLLRVGALTEGSARRLAAMAADRSQPAANSLMSMWQDARVAPENLVPLSSRWYGLRNIRKALNPKSSLAEATQMPHPRDKVPDRSTIVDYIRQLESGRVKSPTYRLDDVTAPAAKNLLDEIFGKKASMAKSAFVKQDPDTGKWILWTRDKKRKLGTHDTPEEAYAQEYAIQKSQERQAEKAAGLDYAKRLHNLRIRRGECPECGEPNQEGKTCACPP